MHRSFIEAFIISSSNTKNLVSKTLQQPLQNMSLSTNEKSLEKAQVVVHDEHADGRRDSRVGEIAVLSSIEDGDTSKAVWLISACVSLGVSCSVRHVMVPAQAFLLTEPTTLGYDTGYISSVLITLGKDLGHTLSANEKELVTSITSGGALVGAIFAGLSADHYGRKLAIYCGCALFIIGGILQA